MFAAGFLGMAALILIAVLASTNRRAIRLRTVGLALALQVAIGALVLYVPLGRRALEGMAHGVDAVLASGKAGIHFLFGNWSTSRWTASASCLPSTCCRWWCSSRR